MNIKQNEKKQYEAPEMSVLDYEYSRDCLLVDSCTDCEEYDPDGAKTYENKPLG